MSRYVTFCRVTSVTAPPLMVSPPPYNPPSLTPPQCSKPKKVSSTETPIPEDFHPNGKHLDLAVELGRTNRFAIECCEEMRDWAVSNGKTKANWDATLSGWMRRNSKA